MEDHGVKFAKPEVDIRKIESWKNSIVTQLTGDEDDLFFVTQQGDFNAMQANQWNAVLQNPLVTSDIEEDDGSLSVYAQMNNIRYINIEAERRTDNIGNNHLETQKQMIDFTFNLISTK